MWSYKITCFFLNYKLWRLCSLPRCLRIGGETTHYCPTTQTHEHVYLVPFLPYNLILLISPFHPVIQKPLTHLFLFSSHVSFANSFCVLFLSHWIISFTRAGSLPMAHGRSYESSSLCGASGLGILLGRLLWTCFLNSCSSDTSSRRPLLLAPLQYLAHHSLPENWSSFCSRRWGPEGHVQEFGLRLNGSESWGVLHLSLWLSSGESNGWDKEWMQRDSGEVITVV